MFNVTFDNVVENIPEKMRSSFKLWWRNVLVFVHTRLAIINHNHQFF
jgi:hypothetical protein